MMKFRNRSFSLCVALVLTALLATGMPGCNRKSKGEQGRGETKLVLPNEVKNITVQQLLPKATKRTGRGEKDVAQKVLEDYSYGTLAGQYGRLNVAVKHLLKALKADPIFTDAHHNLGLAYYRMGKVEQAISEWRRTLELDPTYAETYYNLGVFLADNNRADDSVKLFEEAIRFDTLHLKARYALGKTAQDKGQYQEAIRHYKTFQQKDRGNLKVHLALGETYLLAGMLESSQREYEAAARVDDKNPMIHYQLGVAYHRSNRITEAIQQYKRATELAPDMIDGYVNLGDLHTFRKDYAKALRAYNAALGVDSRNAYARKKSAEMEKRLLANQKQ